jgi:LysM repeat protein
MAWTGSARAGTPKTRSKIANKKDWSDLDLTSKDLATMRPVDKFSFSRLKELRSLGVTPLPLALIGGLLLMGCDRMITPRNAQIVKDADTKSSQGEFLSAVTLYEAALGGTSEPADIHYKLGLLYDDKMNDPLNALHHFKRYLDLRPTGSHAGEVKDLIKRDETTLLTSLSGDSVVTRAEAARLRNENLNLRKQIEERVLKARAIDDKPQPRSPRAEKSAAARAGGQTYVVESGDTLFSISKRFYKSPARWKEIRDANKSKIDDPAKLKPGQTLVIP